MLIACYGVEKFLNRAKYYSATMLLCDFCFQYLHGFCRTKNPGFCVPETQFLEMHGLYNYSQLLKGVLSAIKYLIAEIAPFNSRELLFALN